MDQRKYWAYELWQAFSTLPGSQNLEPQRFNRAIFLLMAISLSRTLDYVRRRLSPTLLNHIDQVVLAYEHLPKAELAALARSAPRALSRELGLPATPLLDLSSDLLIPILDLLRKHFRESDDPLYLLDVAFHRSIARPRMLGRRLTEAALELAAELLPAGPRLAEYFLETGDLAVRAARREGSAGYEINPVVVRVQQITSDESLVRLRLILNQVSVQFANEDADYFRSQRSLALFVHPEHRPSKGHGLTNESGELSAVQALAQTIGRTKFGLAVVAVPARDSAGPGWRQEFRRDLVINRRVLAVIGGVSSARPSFNREAIWLVTEEPGSVGQVLFINAWGLAKEKDADLRDMMQFVAGVASLMPGADLVRVYDDGRSESRRFQGRFSREFRAGYRNVPGLCELVPWEEIEAKNWSLTVPDYILPVQAEGTRPQLDGQRVMEVLKRRFPLRVYVIGSNGQGKSLLLAQVADELSQQDVRSAGLSFGLTDRFHFHPDGQKHDRFTYLGARTSEAGISLRPTKQRLEANIRSIRSDPHRLRAFRSALKTLGFGKRLYLIPGSVKMQNGTIPEKAFAKIEELTESRTEYHSPTIKGAFSLGIIRNDATNRVILFERLSSGEQQLITLAAKLAAKAEMGMVMLVDEPELSLHVRWQRAIPRMLAELSEHFSCAFVVATHSPVLIASTSEDDHCFVAANQVLEPIRPHQRPSVESVLFDDFDTYTTNTRRVHELCAALVSETIHEVNGDVVPGQTRRDPLKRLMEIGEIVAAAPAQRTAGRQRDLELIERTRAAIEELFAQIRTASNDPKGTD